jgi:hypothetical protein
MPDLHDDNNDVVIERAKPGPTDKARRVVP